MRLPTVKGGKMFEDMTICVDIDGVIAANWRLAQFVPGGGSDPYSGCGVIPGALSALKLLKKDGWAIHLYTGRHILHAQVTAEWLERHNIPHDLVVYGKPPARLYIDDRAVRFTNWSDMLEVVENLPQGPPV